MTIDDKNGLYIGTNRKQYRYIPTPDGSDLIRVPRTIHADELFAEDDPNQELNDFAAACLKSCNLAVIGTSDNKILGCRMMRTEKLSPAAMRKASRAAVRAGWRDVLIAVSRELPDKSREAAVKTFDINLMRLTLLVIGGAE